VHLSTGNYNPRTARLYTDMGYLTADPALTADADAVFQQLASQARCARCAPAAAGAVQLHRRCWSTDRAGGRRPARAGQPARIVAKINALTDPALIEALMRCGQAGARST
jgi:polyphosphate kinase